VLTQRQTDHVTRIIDSNRPHLYDACIISLSVRVGVVYCSQRVSMIVCLFARKHISKTSCLNFIKLSLHLTYDRPSAFFPEQPQISRYRKENQSGFKWGKRWWGLGKHGTVWTVCKQSDDAIILPVLWITSYLPIIKAKATQIRSILKVTQQVTEARLLFCKPRHKLLCWPRRWTTESESVKQQSIVSVSSSACFSVCPVFLQH